MDCDLWFVVHAYFTLSAFCAICVVPGLCACLDSGSFASIIALSAETFHYLQVIHMCGPDGQVLTRPEQVKCYQEGSFQLTVFPSSLENLIAPVRATALLAPEDKVRLAELTEMPQPCVRLQVERNQPVLDPQERS